MYFLVLAFFGILLSFRSYLPMKEVVLKSGRYEQILEAQIPSGNHYGVAAEVIKEYYRQTRDPYLPLSYLIGLLCVITGWFGGASVVGQILLGS